MTALLYDEGPGAGLGHRRRMETLALALHQRGHQCHLASVDSGHGVDAPMVIVDSYRVRADELGLGAGTVVAIDDLHRDLAVDVVVDPSPGADASRHSRAKQVFAGAPFVLVAAPDLRRAVVPATDPVTRVLVTTGAADTDGHGARIAASLRTSMPDAELRLVVGPWGSADVPDGVTGVHSLSSLADELAAAPLVVTAGGVSMLEACLLGRAVVAVMTAENQRVAVVALAAAGAVVAASIDGAAGVATALAVDTDRRAALAAAAVRTIDGLGPQRIAEELDR